MIEAEADRAGIAARLVEDANQMANVIIPLLNPQPIKTVRQLRRAIQAQLTSNHLRRTQDAMYTLANLFETGNVPAELAALTTKSAIHRLTETLIDRNDESGFGVGVDSGKPAKDTEAVRTLWAMGVVPTPAELRLQRIERITSILQLASIPGYFPTPHTVASQLIEAAELPDRPCSILEPAAGAGHILDLLKTDDHQAHELIVYESNSMLRSVLAMKNYPITGANFLHADPAIKVDRVIMNPPHDNGQEIQHILRAYNHIKRGGKLVSVVATDTLLRSDKQSEKFRNWLGKRRFRRTELPRKAFWISGTSFTGAMLEIWK